MGIIKDIRGDIEQEANLLLEKYRDALMLEALSLVSGDKHTAEELVLQTFEAHLFKREKYDPSKGELLPWLKGILRNLHGKSQRDRAMRSITYLSPEELEVLSEIRAQSNATDEEIEANSDAEFVRNAIAQLPENARSALMLHYFESLSVRQIAQVLRKSPGSVKGSLHYARKALAKRLGKALGRVALAVGAILFGGTLLYAAAVATGLASSPFVAAEPAAEEETEESEVVFNAKSTEDTEGALEVFGGLDEECLSLGADPTNHESRTTNHETNGDSPLQTETITADSNANNEETTMNTQSVKSAAVRMLAAGAMLAAGSAAALPAGYEQVSYIHGDGQSGYILTNYVPQPNRDKIVIEFELANLSKNSALWCTRSYVSNPKQAATWEMFHLPGTGFRMDYKTDESANRTIFGNSAAANTRYTLTTAGRKVKWSATGDTEYAKVSSDQTVTCRGPLVLLNSYNLTSADDDTMVMESMYAAHRIYSVKIYRDDELMFDLVPAATPNGVGTLCNLTDNAIQIATKGTVFAAGRTIELYDNVYVDSAASEYTQPPYESPSNACPSFALAVAVVATNGTIHVAGGDATHATKEYQCTSATVSFDNAKPFKVAGPADCTAVFLEPNFVFNAGQVWSGLTFSLGNDPAVSANKRDYGIAYLRSGSVASNCVFRGGVGTCVRMGDGLLIDSTVKEFAGCGIYCQANSSPMIVNTEVRDSTDNYPASPRTTSVEQGNPIAAVQFGSPCTPVFEHCRIFNNVSKSGYGAGAFSWIAYAGGTRLVLDRCVVSNNTGRSGIARLAMNQNHDNRIYATNCLFVANRSVDVAGSETTFSATPPSALIRGEFVNCTIADNSGADALFALSTSSGNDCKVVNTVISNNRVSMPSGSIMTTFDGGAASVRYSLYPEASGNNNVTGPAVFASNGYLLARGTPGAYAGDASIWGYNAQDLAGKDRVKVRGGNKYVDMGCYQWMAVGSVYYIR
ncbi:MAG: sigma-70 family RNA polymerase sigma factor [Kiritimatiellae bacterium]|nr:sigma-70 family RNA polymerase sigma factor [Kiritimatiellia bacterium]